MESCNKGASDALRQSSDRVSAALDFENLKNKKEKYIRRIRKSTP